MNPKERRKKPREMLSPFGEMGLAHGSASQEAVSAPSGAQRRRIGVFCEGGDWIFFSPYFGRLFSGIAQEAEKARARIVMYMPDPGRGEKGFSKASKHELGYSGVSELREGLVEGAIIMCGRAAAPAQLQELRSLKIPVVLLSNNRKIPGFSQISSGAYERAYLCAEQLYIEGRKKVGMLGLYANSTYHQDSLRGLKAASKKAKKEFKDSQLQPLNQWDLTKPFELLKCLDVLQKQGCDAIICSEATQSIVALDILTHQKLKMPKQLCLVSFGPLPRSARVASNGALRLLQVDLADEGRRAFALLQQAMAGGEPKSETIRWSWPGY
jgi:DNA-binding LacI/PurR family transcriptional regulator